MKKFLLVVSVLFLAGELRAQQAPNPCLNVTNTETCDAAKMICSALNAERQSVQDAVCAANAGAKITIRQGGGSNKVAWATPITLTKEVWIQGEGTDIGDKATWPRTAPGGTYDNPTPGSGPLQGDGPTPRTTITNGGFRIAARNDTVSVPAGNNDCVYGCDNGDYLTTARYRITQLGFNHAPPIARFSVDNALVIRGSANVSSTTATWNQNDVGKLVTSSTSPNPIPSGTRIASVTDQTHMVMTRVANDNAKQAGGADPATPTTQLDTKVQDYTEDFIFFVDGSSVSVRMDHLRVVSSNKDTLKANDYSRPLMDNCYLGGIAQKFFADHRAWDNQTYADGSWNTPHSFGKRDAMYVEDCVINPGGGSGAAIDSEFGARYTIRYTDFDIMTANNHGTQGSQLFRGTRQVEMYGNLFTHISGKCIDSRGGAGMVWGNTSLYDRTLDQGFYTLNDYRSNNVEEGSASPPANDPQPPGRWGPANGFNKTDDNFNDPDGPEGSTLPTPYATGEHNTNGPSAGALELTVDGPSPNWATNKWKGYSLVNVSKNRHAGIVGNGANTIQYDGATVAPAGVPKKMLFYPGDDFKIGRIRSAIDGCGMGPDQRAFATGTRGTGGCASGTGCWEWTEQIIDGVWSFLNTMSLTGSGASNSTTAAKENMAYIRGGIHYFNYGGTPQTFGPPNPAPFTGSDSSVDFAGTRTTPPLSTSDGGNTIGVGTWAQKPTSCTTRVGYWATDRGGNWNKTNGTTQDGALYTCIPSSQLSSALPTRAAGWDAEATPYYTPLDYPHPLRGACPATGAITSGDLASFTSGQNNRYEVQTCNFTPLPSVFTITALPGTAGLPTNVSFSAGVLSSTAPAAIAAGDYYYTITASNGAGGESATLTPFHLHVDSTNQPPAEPGLQMSYSSPLQAPGTINLVAFASDPDGQIGRIDFLRDVSGTPTIIATLGSTPYTTALSAPYEYQWTNVADGTYSVTVKAYDLQGLNATSSPAQSVTVQPAPSPGVTPVAPSAIKVVP